MNEWQIKNKEIYIFYEFSKIWIPFRKKYNTITTDNKTEIIIHAISKYRSEVLKA